MDDLTALFFEDPEDDGIQPLDSEDSSDLSQPLEYSRGEGGIRGALLSDSFVGEDEPDGVFAVTLSLHQLIRKRKISPRELKEGLKHNSTEWMAQVNELDDRLAPIHNIVLHSEAFTVLLLLNLLTYGNADIDFRAGDGKTALMLAVQANKIHLVKVLVALGANVNIGSEGLTPLKMAIEMSGGVEESTDDEGVDQRGFETTVYGIDQLTNVASPAVKSQDMVYILKSVGARTEYQETAHSAQHQSGDCPVAESNLDRNQVANEYKALSDLVQVKKEAYIRNPCGSVASEAMEALMKLEKYRREHGSRILCLDGGGVKGLVQIEMLRQIEQRTGKRIVELFDWIVGTSTGGIIALALVHGNMSVTALQRLYLRLKRNVFSRSGVLQKGNSWQLEWYLTKQLKGTMDEKSYPRVLVSAVKQSSSGIKLVFFNNCFEDDYGKEEVWKVARYTSAAPLYFSSKDGYLDGGLLADNPTEDALTAIQGFYRKRQMQIPISLVVSLGSGVTVLKEHKAVNVTTDLWNAPSRIFPFLKIVGEALMNPQTDSNCESRCVEQGIRYIRLNPPLEEEVDSAEIDNDKLMNMLWSTRQYLHSARDRSKMEAIVEYYTTSQ